MNRTRKRETLEEKLGIILADWDEEKGPLIIKSIFFDAPGAIEDSPEVLVTRCYINAQSSFAQMEFSRIYYAIPMVSIKKLAIVYLDIVKDAKVRGGKRPFIVVVFAPGETNYNYIEPVARAIEPYLERYKKDELIELETLQETVNEILHEKIVPEASFEQPKQTPQASASARAPVEQHQPAKPAKTPIPEKVQVKVNTPGKQAPRARIDEKAIRNRFRTVSMLGSQSQEGVIVKERTSSTDELFQRYPNLDKIRSGWNTAELQRLEQLHEKGMNPRDIAREMNRRLEDIQAQLVKFKK